MRSCGRLVLSHRSRRPRRATAPALPGSRHRRTEGMILVSAIAVALLAAPARAESPRRAVRDGASTAGRRHRPTPAAPEKVASGGWSWFTDPRAVFVAGAHRRVYTGAVDTAGNVIVTSHDERTGASRTVVVKRGWSLDDHNNPSLLALPDHRLMVFYCRHDGGPLFYRLSRRPESLGFGAERRLAVPGRFGCTYTNPVLVREDRPRVYVFFRGGDWLPVFRRTEDGRHWSPPTTLIDPRLPGRARPYLKVDADATGTIHLAFTEDSPFGSATSIYYVAYRGGRLTAADGTPVASLDSLPFAPTAAMRVYDAAAAGARAWIHDVAVDALAARSSSTPPSPPWTTTAIATRSGPAPDGTTTRSRPPAARSTVASIRCTRAASRSTTPIPRSSTCRGGRPACTRSSAGSRRTEGRRGPRAPSRRTPRRRTCARWCHAAPPPGRRWSG